MRRLRSLTTTWRSKWIVFGALIASIGGASESIAQTTKLRDLSFGTILPGISQTVLPTAATAAQWQYKQLLTLALNATLSLPTSLTRVGGGGSLPISFCNTCAIYRLTNNPVGGTVFNPNVPLYNLNITLLATMYFWLGGTVTPSVTQPAGSYTGTITITLAIL